MICHCQYTTETTEVTDCIECDDQGYLCDECGEPCTEDGLCRACAAAAEDVDLHEEINETPTP